MKQSDYHLFTKEDFLEDTWFLEWVRYAPENATAFWTAYELSNPPNLTAMQEAKAILQGIYSLTRIPVPAEFKEQIWNAVRENIQQAKVVVLPKKRRIGWWAAAVLIPLGILTGYLVQREFATNKVTSQYGEQLKFRLPDSTWVQLNANSELSYKNWKDGKREVYLKGEALFQVKSCINPKVLPFTVIAGNVRVEVLGTTFNVKDRREEVSVFLKEGKVRVSDLDGRKSIVLQPGQHVKYTKANSLVAQGAAESKIVLAWTENKLRLHETAVRDILTVLQDTYGYTIILEDSSLADRKIDGELSVNRVNNVLFELSAILNVKIDIRNDTLTFRSTGQQGY